MALAAANSEEFQKIQEAVYLRFQGFLDQQNKLTAKDLSSFNRTIWRLGELGITQAIPELLKLAQALPENKLTQYSIIWTLGKIGTTECLDIVDLFDKKSNPKHDEDLGLRRICRETRYWLTSDDQKTTLLQDYASQLPDEMLTILQTSDAQEISDGLAKFLTVQSRKNEGVHYNRYHGGFAEFVRRTEDDVKNEATAKEDTTSNKHDKNSEQKTDLVIETFYLMSLVDNTIRQSLFLLINDLKFAGRAKIASFRILWKMAEYRNDVALYAHLIRCIGENPQAFPSYDWDKDYNYAYGMGSSLPYLKRRSWRHIRKLGKIGSTLYLDYAEAILLSLSDRESRGIKTEKFSQYAYDNRRASSLQEWSVTFSEFPNHWAFGHILYSNSSKYTPRGNLKWTITDKLASEERVEAFPELWDTAPERLLGLIWHSQCEQVHIFAAKALKDHSQFLSRVSLEEWFELLASKYEPTALLALQELKRYYEGKEPDERLIRICLISKHKTIRETGQEYLKQATSILQNNLDLLAWMVMSEDASLREQSRNYITVLDGYEQKQQEFIELILGKTFELGEETNQDIVENVTWLFITPLKHLLSIITFDAVGMFVGHASPHVSLFGAKLLSAQNLKPHDIPPELYGLMFNSSNENVRAEAIILMGNLSDAELGQWDDMLGNLMLSRYPAVRKEARTLIARALQDNEPFARKIIQKQLSALFKTESSEGLHEDLFQLFSAELKPYWYLIDKNQLWRMLTAQSKGVQRVAGKLISIRSHSDYSIRQWASLGNNPNLEARSWAWKAYEANLNKVKENIEDALHILNSNWEDSRNFGFNYFSKHFPFSEWSEQLVISLCDSKHEEVRDLGRKLVFEHIEVNRGPNYLVALSENPSIKMQKFIGQFLEKLASDKVEKILELEQYFASVLTRINKGRTAKDQVMSFLHSEALKNRAVAEMVARILQKLSLSAAIHDKSQSIEIMSDLNNAFTGLSMPLKPLQIKVRGFAARARR